MNQRRIMRLAPTDGERLQRLQGPMNAFLKALSQWSGCRVDARGDDLLLDGPSETLDLLETAVKELYELTRTRALDEATVYMTWCAHTKATTSSAHTRTGASRQTPLLHVKARTPQQNTYLEALAQQEVAFGVGPAGTGKTFLAVAHAVHALTSHRVDRIILVRPAVEAGERLGFLPGSLIEKVDPYLRPLYDALQATLGVARMERAVEQGVVEVAPLAFMRGRTLNRAVVLLDEAQNTTPAQMKMFLTRMGFNSQLVITGDPSQCDLPAHQTSGLQDALSVLSGLSGVGITHLTQADVVRHPMVQAMVAAYEQAALPVELT